MWFFLGNGQQIGFSVSENGILSAYGRCSQDCSPGEDPSGVVGRVRNVAGSWSICTPASEEHEYDEVGWGLKQFFLANGDKAAGMISYHPASNGGADLVSLSVLAPKDFAASAFTLLKAAMGNLSFQFVVAAHFIGLSLEGVQPNRIPKLAEIVHPDLMKRRAYLSDRISISIRTFK